MKEIHKGQMGEMLSKHLVVSIYYFIINKKAISILQTTQEWNEQEMEKSD